MFRFYGPEEAFYNKTFKLRDVELVRYEAHNIPWEAMTIRRLPTCGAPSS